MATIDNILNELDDLLENSWNLPLSGGRCVVDAERVRDLIDSVRLNIPTEIKQAKSVVSDRNEILAVAKKEAESLIRKSEERAKVLVDNETVVRNANAKASAILTDANTRASAVVSEANARASAVVSEANARATQMVDEATAKSRQLTEESSTRASDMMTQASQRSREMKQAAYDFAESLLRSSEETMTKTLSEVKGTRQQLRDSAAEALGERSSRK